VLVSILQSCCIGCRIFGLEKYKVVLVLARSILHDDKGY
jgi:hypothetical protein